MGYNKDCGCTPTPNIQRKSTPMFESIGDNPLKPNALGLTFPFAPGGVFTLPKHMTDETPPYEPTPRPNPNNALGIGMNAVFAAAHRTDHVSGGTPTALRSFIAPSLSGATEGGLEFSGGAINPETVASMDGTNGIDTSEYDTEFQDAGGGEGDGSAPPTPTRPTISPAGPHKDAYDRPTPPVRMKFGTCDCWLGLGYAVASDCYYVGPGATQHTAVQEAVCEAMADRRDYMIDKGLGIPKTPDPEGVSTARGESPPGDTANLGPWKLWRKIGGQWVHSGWAFAVGFVIKYDCDCELVGAGWYQQELKDGGWKDDNYGSNEGKNYNKDHLSKEVKVPKDPGMGAGNFCMRVFVDSPGFSRPSWLGWMQKFFIKRFRGWATVTHKADPRCHEQAWLEWSILIDATGKAPKMRLFRISSGSRTVVQDSPPDHKAWPGPK